MDDNPYAPPVDPGLLATRDGKPGRLCLASSGITWQPVDGDAEVLGHEAVSALTASRRRALVLSMMVAVGVGIGADLAGLPPAPALALAPWIGVAVECLFLLIRPSLTITLTPKQGTPWVIRTADPTANALVSAARDRLPQGSTSSGLGEAFFDHLRTLGRPADTEVDRLRRRLALWSLGWMLLPLLLGFGLLALHSARHGGSAALMVLGCAGVAVMIGELSLVPGLLLLAPTMPLFARLAGVRILKAEELAASEEAAKPEEEELEPP